SGYIASLRESLPHAILDESWQTEAQVTITVKPQSLPDVVASLYYHHGGWLSVVVGNDARPLNGAYAVYYVLSMEGGDRCHV
ncbi:hypothetical protein ABTL75_21185, partial [Acinetobacter baumannii]